MEEILNLVGTAGGPTTIIGLCLSLFFYLRRQEAGVRADINGSLARLTAENEDKDEEIDRLHDQIDALREQKRTAQDNEDIQRRRADLAETLLKEQNGQQD